jgi:hypothetical protein
MHGGMPLLADLDAPSVEEICINRRLSLGSIAARPLGGPAEGEGGPEPCATRTESGQLVVARRDNASVHTLPASATPAATPNPHGMP